MAHTKNGSQFSDGMDTVRYENPLQGWSIEWYILTKTGRGPWSQREVS